MWKQKISKQEKSEETTKRVKHPILVAASDKGHPQPGASWGTGWLRAEIWREFPGS